jgi:RNA polymerase sigma-70 factor, ECF subfamily
MLGEGDLEAPSHMLMAFTANPGIWKTLLKMERGFSDLDDELLVGEIQEGKQGAFVELVDRHAKRFYRVAYRLLFSKDDAEDAVQQAFLTLWERKLFWNPDKGAKFTTWFYKVVLNLCLDHNRKKRPMPFSEGMELVDKQDGPEILLDEKRKQALLDRFLQELPERQQWALTLCFYEGLSNKEAAEIIGVKVKALQSLIMRAKTTLKEKLNHHFD